MKNIGTLIMLLGSMVIYAQDCYTLVWNDEFDGGELDRSKWSYRIGNGYPNAWGWGNEEDQYYTDQPDNVEVSNGTLKIRAQNESFGGFNHTSGRIRTKGQFDFRYGRIEARIKIPSGQGTWPALWLLPTEEVYGGWPRSGEIDIMENFGQNGYMSSAIHYQTSGGAHQFNSQGYGLSLDEYHTFAAVWYEDHISFFMDWNWVGDETPADLPGTWPFNEHFHLILNMALGGDAGAINTSFPKEMEVDWIRVYQRTQDIEIQGPDKVFPNETVMFSLPENTGASYSWSLPAGATLLDGAGTNEIVVSWAEGSGDVTCQVTNWQGDINGSPSNCGSGAHSKSVTTLDGDCDVYWLDFDRTNKLVPHQSDGVGGIETWFHNNPGANAVNGSTHVGEFGRAGDQSYDVLKLDFTEPIDVTDIRSGATKLLMDVYTDASGTIPVSIELVERSENSGWPNGVHSLVTANITASNTWQTLEFDYTTTGDWTTPGASVDGINILFNSNSNTADRYYFDNIRTTAPLGGEIAGATLVDQPSESNLITYEAPDWPYFNYDWELGSNTTLSSGEGSSEVQVYFENLSQYTEPLSVDISNSMGCTYSYDLSVIVQGTTGINEELRSMFDVFPNPTSEKLVITSPLGSDIHYSLITSQGISVLEGKGSGETPLNIQNLKPGVYQLLLTFGAKRISYQVLKQ